MNVMHQRAIVLFVGCALYACAGSPPTREAGPVSPVSIGPVSITYTTLAQASAECARRHGVDDGKPRWGCATYSARGCDIVVGDIDRTALLGIELGRCVAMAQGLPR